MLVLRKRKYKSLADKLSMGFLFLLKRVNDKCDNFKFSLLRIH